MSSIPSASSNSSSTSATSPPTPPAASGQALRAEFRALWQLAWPLLIGQLATVGMAVADVAMAGHASAQDLAGVSLGTSIWIIVVVTLMGVMMAVTPLVAHHVGAQEFSKVPHLVRQALWMSVGVGTIALVLANLSTLIFDHMVLEPAVRTIAQQFIYITSVALPAFAAYRVLYGYSASLNQTKPMMVISLLALLLNVWLNWLLVFGNWGLPRLGGVGCAWASMVCVWFNLAGLIWWMRRSPAYASTWPFTQWERPNRAEIGRLLHLGLPIGVTYFAECSAFSLIALLVAKFGSTQVAAHQIALNFSSLTFMVPLSIGLAVLTRVGQALGAGDPVAARYRSWVGVAAAVGFSLVSALIMALFNQQIASAYTNDAGVAALAASLLFLAAIFQISDGLQVSTSCAIRGYKITRTPMAIHLTAFWVVSLPLGCVLGLAPDWAPWHPAQPMKAQGFWIALIVGLSVAGSALAWLLHRITHQHVAHVARVTHIARGGQHA
ncbi:MAG: MATE family efflux transporter [Burkholderiales bacterium PBB3]|nr:MAG: MATE family efflux transporter [Burkholderiales bacterium PBB3]